MCRIDIQDRHQFSWSDESEEKYPNNYRYWLTYLITNMIQNSIRMVPFSKTKISAKWSPHTTLHPWLWRWIGSWPTHGSYIPDQNYLTTSTPVFMCSLTYYLAVFVSWQCSVSPGVSARMNETSAVTIFEITELYESWALYWYTKGERDSNYRDRASKICLPDYSLD